MSMRLRSARLTEIRIAQLGSAPHLVVAQAVCDMLGNGYNSSPPSVEQTVALQSSVPFPPLPPPDRDAYIQRHGMFLVCGERLGEFSYVYRPSALLYPVLHRSMHRSTCLA